MGCGSSESQISKPSRRDTVFGVFEVSVIEAHLQHQTSTLSTMDPYICLKFSNQTHNGEVVKNGGKNPKFKDQCKFFVNSYYKHFGRCLEVQVMDSCIGSDDVIGYGIIDLDPYLNTLKMSPPQQEMKASKQQGSPPPVQKANLRCFVNFDRKQAGFVLFEASFREEKTDVINFRFETAEFSRSTKTFGDMDSCYVRITAGQEVVQTKRSKDTKTDKPHWNDDYLTVTCPKSMQTIKVEVMNENQLIGSHEVNKHKLLIDDNEGQFKEELVFEKKVAGTVWFNTRKGNNVVFKELTGDYKKKNLQEQKKKDDDEKKKKQEEEKKKKEQENKNKKQEEKKEEPKEQKKQEKKEEPPQQNAQNP